MILVIINHDIFFFESHPQLKKCYTVKHEFIFNPLSDFSDSSPCTGPGLCSRLIRTSATSWDTQRCLPLLTSYSRVCWEGNTLQDPRWRVQLASIGVRRLEWRLSASVSMPTSTTTGSEGWRGCCREAEWRQSQGKLWWISWLQLLSPSVPFILVSVLQSLLWSLSYVGLIF